MHYMYVAMVCPSLAACLCLAPLACTNLLPAHPNRASPAQSPPQPRPPQPLRSRSCCGMMFNSRGFKDAAAKKGAELEAALLKASENGERRAGRAEQLLQGRTGEAVRHPQACFRAFGNMCRIVANILWQSCLHLPAPRPAPALQASGPSCATPRPACPRSSPACPTPRSGVCAQGCLQLVLGR